MLGLRSTLIVAAAAWAAPAAADNSSVHATATGDVAATDNVFATSRADAQADAFTQVRPGMLWAYDAPRMIHELLGEVELLEYVLHSDRPSVTWRAGWKGFFLPGPRSEVLIAANASTGQLNALSSRSSPDQTGIGVLPVGTAPIDTQQADGSQYFSWQSSKGTRTYQNAFGRYTATDDNQMMPTITKSAEAGASLGFEATFRHDQFALEAGASFLRFERHGPGPPGSLTGDRLDRQINPKGLLVWRHDIDRHWSVNANGGVVYVDPEPWPDPYSMMTRKAAPYPIFGGLVGYTETWGRATLSAGRSVTPNLFIASNTVDDNLLAQLALPLPWLDENPHARTPKYVALGSLGVERTQLVDPDSGTLQGKFDVARIDLGVSWIPRMGQTLGVRYELAYQRGDSVATAMLPASSYVRNTLFFTFQLMYPDRVAVRVPRRTQSVRADRKDLSPVGAEPVVPDPTEQLPEEE